MKLSLDSPPIEVHPFAPALGDWYTSHPRVRRLWAVVEKATNDDPSTRTRVIIAIGPTLDGDETSPIWLANGHAWACEISAAVGEGVELELLEPIAGMEVDGDGQIVFVQSWRDS